MEKKEFSTLEIEVVSFTEPDVICTSSSSSNDLIILPGEEDLGGGDWN
jgi:hypothetical protein